tara:strand:- start:130 stop:2016 length:1887 start_codon:yes stop_codon:yes gene_type:complete
VEWVQCEQCKKWRTVSTSIDLASLPEQWFCSMNTWNSNFNTCEALQEEDEDDESNKPQKAGKKRKRAKPKSSKDGSSTGRTPRASKTPRVGERASKRSKNVVDYSKGGAGETDGINYEILEQQEKDAKDRAQRRKAKERQVAAEAALRSQQQPHHQQQNDHNNGPIVAPALQWVQCSRCSKWRKLGIGVDSAELPEVWTCSMNDWDNVHNACAVPQEADDTTGGNNNSSTDGYIGDGQLWTGAGAYRKIGQNKYSYRMLISTAMRQTSNTMRRTVQAQHSNEFHTSSAFVDADAVWDDLYVKAKIEVKERKKMKQMNNRSGPEESPNDSGAESNGEGEEDNATNNHTDASALSSSSSSSSSTTSSKRMSFKGKKYRNSGENGGQKIFSWSKIRAIGQQIAKSKTAAALAANKKLVATKSKKKGKKSKNAASSSIESSKSESKIDVCTITSNVVSRLRREEQQCDVLMRLLGRDEEAPAVALNETTLRRALYTVLASADDIRLNGRSSRISEYSLISNQVLPRSGTLPSISEIIKKSTVNACKQLVGEWDGGNKSSKGSKGSKNSGGSGKVDVLSQRLAELVRRGLVEIDVTNSKETTYKKRLSGKNSKPFIPCASLNLKVLKPWKSFA